MKTTEQHCCDLLAAAARDGIVIIDEHHSDLTGMAALLTGCSPRGLEIRAERAIRAHESCADLGGSWEISYVEEGPARSADGVSGGVLVTYSCRYKEG